MRGANKIGYKVNNFMRQGSEKLGDIIFRGGHTAKELKNMRQSYVKEVNALANKVKPMLDKGLSSKDIAKILSAERRAIGAKYKEMTPFAQRMRIYIRNKIKYGDKMGPTIKYLRETKGKTWNQIIEAASRTGGKDLGL